MQIKDILPRHTPTEGITWPAGEPQHILFWVPSHIPKRLITFPIRMVAFDPQRLEYIAIRDDLFFPFWLWYWFTFRLADTKRLLGAFLLMVAEVWGLTDGRENAMYPTVRDLRIHKALPRWIRDLEIKREGPAMIWEFPGVKERKIVVSLIVPPPASLKHALIVSAGEIDYDFVLSIGLHWIYFHFGFVGFIPRHWLDKVFGHWGKDIVFFTLRTGFKPVLMFWRDNDFALTPLRFESPFSPEDLPDPDGGLFEPERETDGPMDSPVDLSAILAKPTIRERTKCYFKPTLYPPVTPAWMNLENCFYPALYSVVIEELPQRLYDLFMEGVPMAYFADEIAKESECDFGAIVVPSPDETRTYWQAGEEMLEIKFSEMLEQRLSE